MESPIVWVSVVHPPRIRLPPGGSPGPNRRIGLRGDAIGPSEIEHLTPDLLDSVGPRVACLENAAVVFALRLAAPRVNEELVSADHCPRDKPY